ncbi:MAG: RNA polymerase sigma factor [Acuticoccus sp.]
MLTVSCPRSDPFSDGLVAAMPRLRAFAHRLSQDPDVADDLVHDTIVQALASQHTFKPGTSQAAWLSTILRNRYFGILRRNRIVRFVSDDGALESVAAMPAQDDALILGDLVNALYDLPADQRDLLIGFTFGNLTYKDAARRFDCSVGTIKSRLNRARAVLRDTLHLAAD